MRRNGEVFRNAGTALVGPRGRAESRDERNKPSPDIACNVGVPGGALYLSTGVSSVYTRVCDMVTHVAASDGLVKGVQEIGL